MCKRCGVCMKAIELNCEWHGIQRSNDGMSLDKGPLKGLKNGL